MHACKMHAVELADGDLITGEQMGKMTLDVLNKIVLDNVVYAPGFSQTLISVKQLIDRGMKVEFTDKCLIYDQPVLRGNITRDVYTLGIPSRLAAVALRPNSIEDWHQRLNHLNYRAIRELSASGAVRGMKIVGPTNPSQTCEICAKSKITRAPAPRLATRSSDNKDEVCHGDLAGPFQRSYNGNRYYLALKWMGHTSVYFLKRKSDAASSFQTYLNIINRRFDHQKNIKIYRSDNGGEFLGGEFQRVCEKEGISTEMSEPEVHYQNGVAERTHRTLADCARALMLQADVPHYLWEYAVRSAVHTRNRTLSKGDTAQTPHEKFWNRKPDLKFVKAFGQRCVVLIPPEQRSTRFQFRPKGRSGIFIGSDPQRKGYFVYVTGHGHRVVHSRSVIFLEPPSRHTKPKDNSEDPLAIVRDKEDGQDMGTNSDHDRSQSSESDSKEGPRSPRTGLSEAPQPLRNNHTSTRQTTPTLRRSARIAGRALSAEGATLDEIIQAPSNLREARRSKDWPKWERAIRREIQALRDNDTFEVVEPPADANIIGSMVAFRVKLSGDGTVERLKARICAQGFTQEFLKDYFETYAPVARLNSIRTFLALITQTGMRVRQGDVPTAYVKAGLKETIYVRQPKGFEEGSPTSVWRLKKALYGLKQAGREWNAELNGFLLHCGLVPTREDPCVYIHPTKALIVLIYVDDLLIGYHDEATLASLLTALQDKYGVKDLGDISWFLGIRVSVDVEQGITTMDQSQYAGEVLRRFGMSGCRPRKTPMDKGTILYKRSEEDEAAGDVPYRQAVGALMYLARVTRPDISFAVNQVAAHASNPSKAHWIAVKNILRYIEGSKQLGIIYRRDPDAPRVSVYTDTDWANDEEGRKSISGAVIYVSGCPVHWHTKR
ncbi:hypothetical protein PF003_g3708 [Phytophthora fragariae]|nr:hypothetical protein PF003_g3708 [Phytophthora fragariae]